MRSQQERPRQLTHLQVSSSPPSHNQGPTHASPDDNATFGLDGLSLIDRARALCAVADDVQRATIEASRRISAIHGSPERPKRAKASRKKTTKEPPDICSRPPSDVPPPRGEGWRRLGPVSVVRGSNRISAQPQARRALTRETEVFVDGVRYCVVPAEIESGGGFCVSLDRDFEGETNMACMLYLRKKRATTTKGHLAAATAGKAYNEEEETGRVLPPSKVEEYNAHYLAPRPAMAAAPAPFGSVGETAGNSISSCQAARIASSPSPFSAGMERELDTFVKARPENTNDGGNSAAVREAQRRARRRAQTQQKREAAVMDDADVPEQQHRRYQRKTTKRKKPPTVADFQKLKASRRAALARVASRKQKESAQKQEAEKAAAEEARRKDAEMAAGVALSQAAAVARAGSVAAEMRQRQRQMEEVRKAEECAKRERVAAVLAFDGANVDERERQVRTETYRRIQREERRRELVLQRQEDERMERMRLYEAGERYIAAAPSLHLPPNPPVHSARSFFSMTGSASVAETVGGDNDPTTAASSCASREYRVTDDIGPDGQVSVGVGKHTGVDSAPRVARHHHHHQHAEQISSRRRRQRTPPGVAAVHGAAATDRGGGNHTLPQTATTTRAISATTEIGSNFAPPAHEGGGCTRMGVFNGDESERDGDDDDDDGDDDNKDKSRRRSRINPPVLLASAGAIRVPAVLSPTLSSSSAGGGGSSAATASVTANNRGGSSSVGSGGGSSNSNNNSNNNNNNNNSQRPRKRIAVTPVWKRPVVPLSKPYVPVPKKADDRFGAS